MKTNLTKVALTAMVVGMAFGSASAENIGSMEFPGFVKHIECREMPKDINARPLPTDPTEALKKAAVKAPSRFIGWNAENPSMPNFVAKSSEAGEQMDSVVGTYLDGFPMSKQEFYFTEDGSPLECRKFLPNAKGTEFRYTGHFEYAYDALGRLISAESTDVNNFSACQRMEYAYSGDSRIYNQQIAYLMDEEGEEWIPFQRGEYEFDVLGNTVKEIYSSWDVDMRDWQYVKMTTATYDDMSRMTSYFPYVWDASAKEWIGDQTGYYEGQSFEYTQDGQDAVIMDYKWLEGEWMAYYKRTYEYNDSALMIRLDRLYWNREAQDWTGNEVWNQWGNVSYNQYETCAYDEYGRLTETNVFTSASGEYVNYYRSTNSYELLENGDTEIVNLRGSVLSDGEFSPYSKTIQHINKFGSENYYMSYNSNEGEWIPFEEQIRYMDEYNWFLGGDYYMFRDGERKPLSKERFTYPEDFDPTLGYETPIEGRHWVGMGTDDWHLKHVDSFTWGPRDVMIGYVNYDYLQSDGNKTSGWEMEYDFSANTAEILMWPDNNKGAAYYENKTLKSTTYINTEYWDDVDEWNPEYSYTFTYFYSPRTSTGVDAAEDLEGVVEVARFDLAGRRLTAPTEGVNIVRYSDGSSRKVMVK